VCKEVLFRSGTPVLGNVLPPNIVHGDGNPRARLRQQGRGAQHKRIASVYFCQISERNTKAALSDTQNIVALSDTSEKTREIYLRRLAEMTPAERVRLGVALWEAGDALQRSAAHRNDPDLDDAEISFRIAISRFGAALAQRAYRKT
jgi:hypothetical protein